MIIVAELTKRQALEECLKLWKWLAKTGEDSKDVWPGWKEWDEETDTGCPACHYSEDNCGDCILTWGPDSWDTCCHLVSGEDGLFAIWEDAVFEDDRQQAAQAIVDITLKALEELNQNE